MSTTVTIVKLVFIGFIAWMAFISGILPTKIPWCKNSVNVLGIANAFSGGVFLAIAFMHILPEVAESYNEYLEGDEHQHDGYNYNHRGYEHGDDEDNHFPLPFALVFVGYAFILLIDKVIFDTHSLVGDSHHGHVHDPVETNFIQNAKSSFVKFQKMMSGDVSHSNHEWDNNCINESVITDGIKQYLSRNDKFAVRMSVALKKNRYNGNSSKTFIKNDKGLDDDQVALFQDQDNIDFRNSVTEKDQVEIDGLNPHPKKWWSCNLTPVVLMIALSTHAIFEGIAVGVVGKMSDLWTYVIAISLHKWAAAMSLGISMSKNFKDEGKTIYVLLWIFSFATPLGISIGMLVKGSSDLTDIVFSSLAGGTFVYIACSEVIVEEFSTPSYKWIKLLVFLLGAALITGLNFIES